MLPPRVATASNLKCGPVLAWRHRGPSLFSWYPFSWYPRYFRISVQKPECTRVFAPFFGNALQMADMVDKVNDPDSIMVFSEYEHDKPFAKVVDAMLNPLIPCTH